MSPHAAHAAIIALLPLWLVLADSDVSRVRTQRANHYYDIEGGTAEELRAAINRSGPFDAHGDGKRYDGFTNWYVGWTYDYRNAGGACRLTRLDVRLEINVTFPRWTDQSHASADLVDRWNAYLRALSSHEVRHEEIGRRAAETISALRDRIAQRPSCDQLEAEIRAMADETLSEARREEFRYDKDTDHGRTQGAHFP